MHYTAPRRVAHYCDLGLAASMAATVAVSAAYWHPRVPLPWQAAFMLYVAAITAVAVFGVGAILARSQMAVVEAFSAGVAVGRSQAVPTPRRAGRADVGLRVVE